MPQYLSPGVYVEEVPSADRPIAGVGTSTAGFIGVVPDDIEMPEKPGEFEIDDDGNIVVDGDGNPTPKYYRVADSGEAIRITNWQNFQNSFGKFSEKNKTLGHAVHAFFNNGGTACYVIRVKAASANAGALDSFKAIDEIAMVSIPGVTSKSTQEAILSHCENMKDRFAILDGQQSPSAFSKEKITDGLRNAIDGYAAVYFPWLEVYDPISGKNDYIAPSGFVAGIYSRTDATRGVHKAPANEVIRGALGVQHRLSRADQDALNPDGINVIRPFNGSITVWGARTFADPGKHAEWKYISTRRFFNFLRESIEEGTRWVVFEPNDMRLWQKIKRNITAFLTVQWRNGALFGATPEEAFYVKCDEETNPKAVRDLGQVVTEIGVAIVNPAEFVIFRISQWSGPSAS